MSCECKELDVKHIFNPRGLILECYDCGFHEIIFIRRLKVGQIGGDEK